MQAGVVAGTPESINQCTLHHIQEFMGKQTSFTRREPTIQLGILATSRWQLLINYSFLS
jgi:hypothetical protein